MKYKKILVLFFIILCFISTYVFADNVIENNTINNSNNIVENTITNNKAEISGNEINNTTNNITNSIVNNTIINENVTSENSIKVTNQINTNTTPSNTINNNQIQTNKSMNVLSTEGVKLQQSSPIATYATRSVAVTTEQMLKHYLTLNDGNTYNIYLESDITITDSIFQVGTKNLYGQGHTIKANIPEDQLSVIHAQGNLNIDNTKFNGNGIEIHLVAVRNGGHINATNSSFYNGTQGIHVDTTSSLTVTNCSMYGNELGIGILGTVTINSATIYGNTQGVHNNGGTVTVNDANIYNNEWGILNTHIGTLNGGNIHDNDVGIVNSLSDAHLTVNGGNIYNNGIGIRNGVTLTMKNATFTGNEECAIYHKGELCTITGGTFNANQVVYLDSDDKYVTTNSSYPVFEVKPNSYKKGRVVIKTSSNSCANTEITKASLTPNSNWALKVNSSDIVIWKKGSVVVKHVNQSNSEIADKVTINGYVDDNYTTSSKTIYGYNLSTTPSNSTGKFTESTITVTYKYSLKDTKVVVNYKDQSGNVLETKTITGKVFDNYEVSSKEIYGYKLVTNASNAKGTMTEATITVNFIYQKIYGNIKVTIVDRDNESTKIKGATVTLYNNSGTAISTKTTDANGQVNFTNLEVGTYKIGQTKAISNYSLADKEISSEINNSKTSFDLKLLNYKKVELPKAGGQSLLFIILGAIFMVISIIIYKFKIKKGEK